MADRAESFYLVDGHSQIYRAYYAPFQDLHSPTGEPTRATLVFCTMLLNLLRDRQPDYVAVALDGSDASDQRREIFAEYKTNRRETPEDLRPQIDRIIAILQAMRMPVLTSPGLEADDVMATLCRRLSGRDLDIYLVSRDKDLEQLITPRVRLYDPLKNEIIDAQALQRLKGYLPEQAVEIQTLTGDSIDNIPGVPGVGPKTAVKLIQQYGSAEAVLAHAAELSPKLAERLAEFAPNLPRTRELVRLRGDAPVDFDLEQARRTGLCLAALRPIFSELGFVRLSALLDKMAVPAAAPAAVPAAAPEPPRPPSAPGRYQLVDSPAKLRRLAGQLATQPRFALDTEATGLQPLSAQLVGVSLCWTAGEAYYIPLRAAVGDIVPLAAVSELLGPVLADASIAKCAHNAKFDRLMLRQAGLTVAGLDFDSLVASFLLEPLRPSHGLGALAREIFGHAMMPIEDLIGRGRSQTTIDQIDSRLVCEYAAEDADYTWRLYQALGPQIQQSSLGPLFAETEMPLVEVLEEMEWNGVAIDAPLLQRMSVDLDSRIAALAASIHQAAGRRFNIDSTRELSRLLFDELSLRVVRKTKTGRSTDADTLSALAAETGHPLPGLVLEYRELVKLKNTYVDSLPKMVSPRTGRIHASFNMAGAVTGRLSSNDPNLQNIPIRGDIGREIRRAFVAGLPDHVLLTADYSQIELRLLAHYSRDPVLREAFATDQDIHRLIAAQLFDVPLDAVPDEARNRAKAVNFGIIYGQGPYGLSRQTGMTVEQARTFIDMYFMRYPGIRNFIDHCIAEARARGYATTILGRQRPVPQLHATQRAQRQLGERIAVNTVLQGSAADLIKRAMIDIHSNITRAADGPRMLIQVHDELVFEVHRDRAAETARRIAAAMTSALPLDVPLKVDVGWGANWLDSKKNAG